MKHHPNTFDIRATAAGSEAEAWNQAQKETALPAPLPVHDFQARLNFVPTLTWVDRAGSLLLGAMAAALTAKFLVAVVPFMSAALQWGSAVTGFAPALSLPPWLLQSGSWLRIALVALSALVGYRTGVYFASERYYKRNEVAPEFAAYEDSMFSTVEGVRVHFQAEDASDPTQCPPYGVQLLHGFGANTSSWALVIKPLAQALGATVAAHDKPGFGLTHRPASLASYSAEFNGLLGRRILEQRLQQARVGADFARELGSMAGDGQPAPSCSTSEPGQILCGHSLGGLSAVYEAIRDPRGLTHLVLVAPAVVPGVATPGPLKRLAQPVVGLLRYCAGLFVVLASPFILYTLRTVVRNRAFWVQGLRAARFNRAGLTDALVDGYRRPSVVEGWDFGLLRFLRSRLSGYTANPLKSMLTSRGDHEEDDRLVAALSRVVRQNKIKVLIVHGRQDALVPFRNSQGLQRAIGEDLCTLVPLDNVGHCPQEEVPEDFVRIVADFVKNGPK